jgi:hypothetical protein
MQPVAAERFVKFPPCGIRGVTMSALPLRLRAVLLAAGVAILASSGWAVADPPSRVARLGYVSGAVSFSPAGEDHWVQAGVNRPLTTGDRLWSDAGGRAELQVGGTDIRMGSDTGATILNLDDEVAQLQLTQGALNVRVRRLGQNQVFEVDTPNLAFTLRRAGTYRIEVDPDGQYTTIVMRAGQGEVYGQGAAYVIDSGQSYRFTGTDLREDRRGDMPRYDDFDRWSNERDHRYDNSVSGRYVSPDMIGYQDLDANGTWRTDATYGNVWYPSRVGADWAPYRDGHWAWIDPWGWTWVDDAPWGFAVSHYGRWANFRGTWGWVPGPTRSRAYYAPALVAFVGGSNFQITISSGNVGGIAWFPLGPREVYRPSYPVSRGYFENVNRSNTVINNTVINNYYNNTNVTNIVYANQQVNGAIVAVPATAFVQSQPVSRSSVRVTREMVASAPVTHLASVAPTERSVRGAADAKGNPPARVFERPAVARTAPPAPRAGFEAQRSQLAAQPGKPLDNAARQALKPTRATPAPAVTVVERASKAPPTRRPPQAAAAKPAADARIAPEPRAKPEQPAKAEPRAKPEQPVKAEPRAKPEQPVKAEPRAKPEQQPTRADPRAKPEQPIKAEPRSKLEQPVKAESRAKPEQPVKADPRAKPERPAKADSRTQPPKSAAEKAEDKKKADDKKKQEREDEQRGKQ